MRRALALLAALWCGAALAAEPATIAPPAVQAVAPAAGALFGTNAVQGCGSMATPVATFAAAGQAASLNCPGAGTYDVRIVPAAGNPLVGTFTSADLALPSAPSGRRLYKNGVGPLENTAETLTASNTGPLTYRTNGGDNLTLTLTGYTSGSAQVYITASFAPAMVLVNGSIDTREEAALRQGKAFTASTGNQSVAANSYLSLTLSNPAGSGFRYVIPPYGRVLACDNPSNALLPKFYSVGNVTTNTVTTAATVTRRGGSSGSSTATATYGVATARPDTNPSTSPAVGNPFFGAYPIAQDRTLEPGSSTTLSVLGVTTGLTGSPTCSVLISWYEESLT